MVLYALGAIAFWFLEFLLQYYWLTPGFNSELSLIRSFSLTGATLIGLALSLSVIFRWAPHTAQYWRVRRYLGVSGAVFASLHAFSAQYLLFSFDLKLAYFSFNPIVNPIVFGTVGLFIFLVMAFTSSDWAVQKLTPRVWKFIHRFVYVAFLASVFHFLLMNPIALKNPPGYLLLAVSAFVLAGHLQLFIKTAWRRRFRSPGSWAGIAIIAGTLGTAYLAREGLMSAFLILFS